MTDYANLPVTDAEQLWLRNRLETLTAKEALCLTALTQKSPPATSADFINHLLSLADCECIAAGSYDALGEYLLGEQRVSKTLWEFMLVRAQTAKAAYNAAQEKQTTTTPSGGGGSYTPPAPTTITFSLPETAYVGESTVVEVTSTNAVSTAWALTVNGAKAALPEDFPETAVLSFVESGEYVLTGTVKNSAGREMVCTGTTTVYPVASPVVTMPAVAHTDKAVTVAVTGELCGMPTLKQRIQEMFNYAG